MSYVQENRLLAISTPLGDDVLLLQELTGTEGISRLFSFQLELLSESGDIDFRRLIGKNVTISITEADSTKRHINGMVSRFGQSGTDARFTHYRMEVVPSIWLLTRQANCKIFQNQSIPDIIQKIFADAGITDFRLNVTGTYNPREYCVQYRETPFNFISRWMEYSGIFYFFEHQEDKHTMVIADSATAHQYCPNQSQVSYNAVNAEAGSDDVITRWNLEQELRTGKYTHTDYNFLTPKLSLQATEATVYTDDGNGSLETFDYPGDYLNGTDGRGIAETRMQEEEAVRLVGRGSGVCRNLVTGYKFDLLGHPRSDMNVTYLLTEVRHLASAGGNYLLDGQGKGSSYSNQFTCIPASVPFRPQRVTPRPFVQGPQPALVVGKSGEEIWVDQYGRITVQFYWDRLGTKDENSSCWIRVAQPWAGKAWGAIAIPRIGQEVIVEFVEGDPDRPIVTGSVYNADQTVPYDLPANQTRTSWMSRSSKGGGAANYNELRFEDKAGAEQIFLNAEMDMDQRVENDFRTFIGKDRSLIVKGKEAAKVTGDSNLDIGGDLASKIEGAYSLQVGSSTQEKSGQNWAHEAGTAIHLKSGTTFVVEAGVEITLKASGSFITIGPSGVAISGAMVMINSGGSAGSGAGSSPKSPVAPDEADDGSKGGKMG